MFIWIDRTDGNSAARQAVRESLATHLGDVAWRDAGAALIATPPSGPFEMDVFERDGRVAIYWGELYNATELAAEIGAARGPVGGTDAPAGADAGTSPAAIVWHLHGRDPAALLPKLNGVYALAVWSTSERRLLAAADRFGILPLRCYIDDRQLVVASRAEWIRACPGVRADIDPQSLFDYVTFGVIPAPGTAYRNIRKIACREYALYADNALDIRPHSLLRFPEDTTRSRRDMLREMHTVIEHAVARRMPAGDGDEAIGAFLSGGLDSSTVLGKMTDLARHAIDAFTIGFDEPRFNEMEYARIAAKRFDARLHEHYVTPAHTLEAIDEILAEYDEPFGNASAVPVYHCARFARDAGKSILMAGDGGDELFAGNPQYMTDKILGTYQLVPRPLRRWLIEPMVFGMPLGGRVGLVRKARSYIRRSNTPNPERLFSYGFVETHGAESVFHPDFLRQVDPGHVMATRKRHYDDVEAVSDVNRVLHVDLNIVISDGDLPKVTAMCRRAGVRVRYPMLDPEIVAFAGSLRGAWLLRGYRLRAFYKDAMEGYLPAEIIAKKKHGFGLPFSAWLKREPALKERMRQAFADPTPAGLTIFRDGFLDDLVRMYEADATNYYGSIIWVLMMLLLWLQRAD